MLRKIDINNYKSVDSLTLELGRFNVLIGENGCGKSNLLEAIGFASAAINDKIDNGYLSLKGIRIADPVLYRSGFEKENLSEPIIFNLYDDIKEKEIISLTLKNDNEPFSAWSISANCNGRVLGVSKVITGAFEKKFSEILKTQFSENNYENVSKGDFSKITDEVLKKLINITIDVEPESALVEIKEKLKISDYLIFAPENFFLRNYELDETYNKPLGHRGEGLLKLLEIIKQNNPDKFAEVVKELHVINWFNSMELKDEVFDTVAGFKITDKYLKDGIDSFDIRNSNEGLLYLLFYFTLFVSEYTPSFFAIDNIDSALNPKLCSKLITVLYRLAKKYDKQVIFTTHNPAILDGLDLKDDEQRLLVVSRNKLGKTRVTRIEKGKTLEGEVPVKLSTQFLNGLIGGLPKGF